MILVSEVRVTLMAGVRRVTPEATGDLLTVNCKFDWGLAPITHDIVIVWAVGSGERLVALVTPNTFGTVDILINDLLHLSNVGILPSEVVYSWLVA